MVQFSLVLALFAGLAVNCASAIDVNLARRDNEGPALKFTEGLWPNEFKGGEPFNVTWESAANTLISLEYMWEAASYRDQSWVEPVFGVRPNPAWVEVKMPLKSKLNGTTTLQFWLTERLPETREKANARIASPKINLVPGPSEVESES
ncbi:hypothetical protein IAT40_007970 [Kwoniella sp. CBS 6097]